MAQHYRVPFAGTAAGSDQSGDQAAGNPLLLDSSHIVEADEAGSPGADFAEAPALPAARGGRWPLVLAALVVAGWTGFYLWAAQGELVGLVAAPRLAAGMIAEWAVPVLLVGLIWLIALRHSRAEVARFADSAAALRRESSALEERLIVVNRELSLAREFLAVQSRELETLGRIAAERISRHASELQSLIQHNDAQVSAIAATSESALANMNRLRDDLPVVANSARDATNQIGNAGRTASEQVEKLVTAFDRLNQFGTASAQAVGSLETRVAETLGQFENQVARIDAVVTGRFAALQSEVAATREQVSASEDEALAALRSRLADLTGAAAEFDAALSQRGSAFEEQIEQRQAAFETREAQASEVLAQRLAELDDALAQRREAQLAETEKLLARGAEMAGQLDGLSELIARVQQASAGVRGELGEGLGALQEQLAAKQRALGETQGEIAALTEASVRLLEIIQSGARFAREDLAGGIAAASHQIGAAEAQAEQVKGLMLDSAAQGASLDAYLIKAREDIAATDAAIGELDAGFAARTDDALARLQGLRGGFARLAEESGVLAASSQEALRTSLGEIDAAIAASIAALDDVTTTRLPALAEGVGAEVVAVLERALRIEAAATIGKLEQSAAHASGIGREAVVQLRDQLAMVNELTGNLEQRIARAREQAEEQVNNDFARRMALITDSLNSAAIDITAALSTEVSDTAWQAYLKGDRGIFTRRAVRLIDSGTTREIAEMYERDDAFRGHVSRYIHDFEAMLRSLLSARGGNVMSVTMLGSDMGKLYVVLAQAIQRLRT
jgi:hypothetical protein